MRKILYFLVKRMKIGDLCYTIHEYMKWNDILKIDFQTEDSNKKYNIGGVVSRIGGNDE